MSLIQSHGSSSFLFYNTGFSYQMSEKCKSTSPNAIQVKNWRKTISTDEKLGETSLLEEK
jgi:hypothetical protein